MHECLIFTEVLLNISPASLFFFFFLSCLSGKGLVGWANKKHCQLVINLGNHSLGLYSAPLSRSAFCAAVHKYMQIFVSLLWGRRNWRNETSAVKMQ